MKSAVVLLCGHYWTMEKRTADSEHTLRTVASFKPVHYRPPVRRALN